MKSLVGNQTLLHGGECSFFRCLMTGLLRQIYIPPTHAPGFLFSSIDIDGSEYAESVHATALGSILLDKHVRHEVTGCLINVSANSQQIALHFLVPVDEGKMGIHSLAVFPKRVVGGYSIAVATPPPRTLVGAPSHVGGYGYAVGPGIPHPSLPTTTEEVPPGKITCRLVDGADIPSSIKDVPSLFRRLHPNQAETCNEISIPANELFKVDDDDRTDPIRLIEPIPHWVEIL